MKYRSFKAGLVTAFFTIQTFISITVYSEQSANVIESLKRLKEGNEKYLQHSPQERRTKVAQVQRPFAIILSCSDSRVTPELVFNQQIGDLFVIRVAGHVINNAVLGSIEYAIEKLGSSFIVVLGHERCGAVQAALEVERSGKPYKGKDHIKDVVNAILPAIDSIPIDMNENKAMKKAVRANIKFVVEQVRTSRPIIEKRIKEGKVGIVGANYDLDSGKVTFLEKSKVLQKPTKIE